MIETGESDESELLNMMEKAEKVVSVSECDRSGEESGESVSECDKRGRKW